MNIKRYKELSDDISNISNPEDIKLQGKYEIEEILDIFTDPKDLPTNENAWGVNTDLSVREIKRGDYIWITALLRKPGQSFNSPAIQGVIKLRVVDLYYGLQYLNKVINK